MTTIDLAPNNPYGLTLRGPVLTAAGCFGYGVEYARVTPIDQLGAIVSRSVTLRGRRAAQPARLIETPAGLLCAAPWPDGGLRAVVERYAPIWATWPTPVLLSVSGDYAAVAAAIEGVEGIAGVELALGADVARAAEITAATRAATQLPLLVKLPPHDALVATAQAVAAAGADALTLIAPPLGLALDPLSGAPVQGYLCGPAIRPLALRAVAEVRAALGLPLIGCGGVASVDDVRAFLAVGATAVQLGAALLSDPLAAAQIARSLTAAT